MVGFMTRDGKLIGQFAEPTVGHDVLSWMISDTMVEIKQSALDMVREIRATGYYGQERWLQCLEEDLGEAVVASRQLEAVVTNLAAAWLDGEMDELELWNFAESNLHRGIAELATILRDAYARSGNQEAVALVEVVARYRKEFPRFKDEEGWSYGQAAVSAVLATMVVRQVLEDACRGGEGTFAWGSSNVAASFLDACLSRLDEDPLAMPLDGCLRTASRQVVTGLKRVL